MPVARERIKRDNDLTDHQAAELAAVLARLADGAEEAVGNAFLGAYLVGSFARGSGDAFSDVDFLVVTEGGLGPRAEQAVRQLHSSLPESDSPWARHLEGSYAPLAELRHGEGEGRPWLYVDNGSREMAWSTHDNSANLRWMLWEHGIALAGPEPRTLLDPVAPERLAAEALASVDRLAGLAASDPALLGSAWSQPHCVLAMCRFLFSAATGTVTSKREAGEWAIDRLDARWAALIRRALDDRPDPWERVHRPSDPELVAPTREFLRYGPQASLSVRPGRQ